jgi:hypothetical protein
MTAPTITQPSTGEAYDSRTGTPLLAMPSEQLLYEARLRITGVTEYGVALADITARKVPIPPEGIRLDFPFEGTITGPRLDGSGAGVDYALIRADGRIDLHIHARITTVDGATIAMVGEGKGLVGASGVVEIRETVRLHSSHPRYKWVNTLAPRGTGTVDFATGQIHAWSTIGTPSPPKPSAG